MTDFPPPNNPNAAPYYQPITNDYNTPLNNEYPQNNPNMYQPPIQVNQPYNSSGANAIYRSPLNCIICVIVTMFFIMGTGIAVLMVYLGISSGDTNLLFIALFPLLFTLISCIMGSLMSVYFSINIQATFGTIIISKKKMCCCFSKKEILQINDVQQVIVQTDYSTTYQINGVPYSAFEIIFKLRDGREVKGLSGVIDKNGEGRKAFVIIRNALPQNIAFGGNLAY